MKLILKSVFSVTLIAAMMAGSACFGQATAGQHKPYRNLAKWYGTQAAPTPLEKAQWALDDINAYRAEKGLSALSETILTSEQKTRKRLFRRFAR